MNIYKTMTGKTTATAPVSRGSTPARGAPATASSAHGPTPSPSVPEQRRTVRFELDAPGAKTVAVVGTFNNWARGTTPLMLQGGSKWVSFVLLPQGRHEYRFVVDGKWTDDPKARAYTPNPHGGRNAVLTV